jgi:saccharopine dehydrogenase-like NADP-dependent oxidoreductase
MGVTGKKALVLGAGLQGKAVIHDLERSSVVSEIAAADIDIGGAGEWLARMGLQKVSLHALDASDERELKRFIHQNGVNILICMLPPSFGYRTARVALKARIPFVSCSYTGQIAELDGEARASGVTILPEMGMDPGIDLLLGKLAVLELDEVHGLHSYGTGLPEPCCADNYLKYKITWTFDGVLKAYKRPARFLRDGTEVSIPGNRIFRSENVHLIDVPCLGELEAYPNGDAIRYIDLFGLGKTIKSIARFGMRYPGHCSFWQSLAELGFLSDDPISIDGANISPHQFLVHHLTPQLQFGPHERDVVLVRVHAWGLKNGEEKSVIFDLLDYRDLESGFFAMNRTVGYTSSIAAQMVLAGTISRPGVLWPGRDVPAEAVLRELESRGMRIERSEQ